MPERPLECSDCRKPACYNYIQVGLQQSSELSLCHDCPMLGRLMGEPASLHHLAAQTKEICCGHCATTMEMVQMGSVVGCTQCYDVFADVICNQILKVAPAKIIHSGRGHGEKHEPSPSLHLYALNEALQETLSREEYEQAAHIRDQINALMQVEKTLPDSTTPVTYDA